LKTVEDFTLLLSKPPICLTYHHGLEYAENPFFEHCRGIAGEEVKLREGGGPAGLERAA